MEPDKYVTFICFNVLIQLAHVENLFFFLQTVSAVTVLNTGNIELDYNGAKVT